MAAATVTATATITTTNLAEAATTRSYASISSATSIRSGSREIQIIVKLDNAKSHLLKFHAPPLKQEILDKLSAAANLPSHILHLHNSHLHLPISYQSQKKSNANDDDFVIYNDDTIFLSAYTFSPILGGKGGFGTLLKGLSKQAGAKQTTDFGACRDLNGRRLRHVNDELKLQKWRQAMQRRAKLQKNGLNYIDIEKEFLDMQTETGVRNWHLAVPSWGAGEISEKAKKKEELKMKRELREWARQENESIAKKIDRKRQWEQVKVDYATVGLDQDQTKGKDDIMTKSILKGMQKRRKLDGKKEQHDQDDPHQVVDDGAAATAATTSFLCTLSGDVIVEDGITNSASDTNTVVTMIQSKSEFATATILIDANKFKSIKSNFKGLYYEIIIGTEGIAQIGWAKIAKTGRNSFVPNSDTGDGVGDDAFSYGYDGLRRMVFHDGREVAYGPKESTGWKKGDVIGCLHDYTNGVISFSVNGRDFGNAFDVRKEYADQLLYPVLSLNENEIVGINIGATLQYCPKGCLAISTIIADQNDGVDSDEGKEDEMNAKEYVPESAEVKMIRSVLLPPSKDTSVEEGTCTVRADPTEKKECACEPIDLEKYKAVQELEVLGMEKLKEELYRLGCKCGGSLSERAKRLYSLKGLCRDQFPQKVRGKNFNQSPL